MPLLTVHRLILTAGLFCGTLASGQQAVISESHARVNAGDRPSATAAIAQPVIGYVARRLPVELLPIVGVPGSATFGRPLGLPRQTTLVVPAPHQAFALLTLRNADPAVLPLEGGTAGTPLPIRGALRTFDRAVFSPLGRSVVLYAAAAQRLQVIGGLPDSAQIKLDITTRDFPGPLVSVAVSDDGVSVLFSASGAVYQLLSSGSATRIVNVEGAAALAFLPDSNDAAVGDSGSGAVFSVRSGAVASAYVLATGLAGLNSLNATEDGRSLWVACPGQRVIWSVDIVTGQKHRADLTIAASGLDRLHNGNTFLIAAEPGQPAWIAFLEGETVRTVFVPAIPQEGVRRRVTP